MIPHRWIVVGLIVRAGEVLIDRRLDEGTMAGLWELPGGKVEADESPEQALQREVTEELGITVEVRELLVTLDHRYPTFDLTISAYHCRYQTGTPRPLASQELRWVKPEDLINYPFPPANYGLFDQIRPFLTQIAQES
ncbi:8-oxo-dGTP diphosphatase MutT [Candidatus Cyanaurora vandensis]|uniref:8-oxo-dGTP diphosphatase MutT n=1 Tax=Candidatus Cyanaurora vandensis TaxID=2714958 RepID=UPI00257B4D27|nr:8-oxo-dGTP diphosphatase MutT [Candidatus Cyanaurora vandensis]